MLTESYQLCVINVLEEPFSRAQRDGVAIRGSISGTFLRRSRAGTHKAEVYLGSTNRFAG